MSKLPNCITYSSVRPQGFSTQYKKLTINPQMNFNTLKTNEYIKFQLNTDGFIDPYSVYIDVTIQAAAADVGQGGLFLDGQSTSLINELIITQQSTNRELERIVEYDQIGNILYDLNQRKLTTFYETYLGTLENKTIQFRQSGQQWQQFAPQSTTSVYAYGFGYRPGLHTYNYGEIWGATYTAAQALGIAKEHNKYHSTNNPYVGHLQQIINETCIGVEALDSAKIGKCYTTDGATNTEDTTDNNPSKYGFDIVTSQTMQPNQTVLLSSGVYASRFDNGVAVTANTKGKILSTRLLVPLLSGMMGHLIPQAAWKLIPAKALSNLLIEIRMNPYAFFSSGYTKVDGTGVVIPRTWQITDISLNMDLWFYDSIITSQIDQMLNGEGIILTSQNFTLGPQYQISNTGQLQNSWIIPGGVESANALFIWILSNDYMKYPYCRKHFRLSGNLTWVQLKIGADYIPPYPLTGYAGKPALVDGAIDDNTDYVVELHKAAGTFLDTDKTTRVNKENFCINNRLYDPTSATVCKSYDYPAFEETRLQGKALYCIRLDNNPFETDVMSGFNTKQKSPIELVLKVDSTVSNTRDQTLYLAYWHDYICQYKMNQTQTFGQN